MKATLALLICCIGIGCSEESTQPRIDEAAASGAVRVFATSYPLAFFAERIGAGAVEVAFPAPEGIDPAEWNPDAATIAQAQDADLLLRSGVGDPIWLDLASLHRNRVVDTTMAARDRLLEQETVRHQHGPTGEHSHGEWAGTPWLDPTLAAVQATALAEALIKQRPAHAEQFRSNLHGLTVELERLDAAQSSAADRLGDRPLLFSHPVYAYLQARYGLNGRSVVWEPREAPGEAQWRDLRSLLAEHPARVMLWESPPLPETVERLARSGVRSRVYATAANRPETGDWLEAMQANLRMLEALADEASNE
jgi:zinc transport system substrate-binding protein